MTATTFVGLIALGGWVFLMMVIGTSDANLRRRGYIPAGAIGSLGGGAR